jgi:ElaB/YqjD/DUF883 family membrane-anchored ribosome-binding protein
MTTQATISNETNSRMSNALETAGKIAEVGLDFALLKKRLESAVGDVVRDTERMAKHGRHAVQDGMDDTTYWIKKNPWQSVGYAAGAAFGIGLCIGWFTSRLSARGDH